MKATLKLLGIVLALVLLGGVMAYLAGFFETKIPMDFSGVVPSADDGKTLTVEVKRRPNILRNAASTTCLASNQTANAGVPNIHETRTYAKSWRKSLF